MCKSFRGKSERKKNAGYSLMIGIDLYQKFSQTINRTIYVCQLYKLCALNCLQFKKNIPPMYCKHNEIDE